MAGFDLTTFAAALKTRYSDDYVDSMVYPDKPLFALLSKRDDFDGDSWKQPALFEDPQAVSSVFANAQTQGASAVSGVATFQVTRVREYGVVTIDGELIKASAKDTGAFYKQTMTAIDGIFRAVGRSASTHLYRDGFGALGTISAGTNLAAAVISLTNKQDVVNFAKGMVLVFSGTNSGGTTRNSGGTLTVVGVDRNAGTVTVNANINTNTGTTNGDFIFRQGDYCTGTTRSKLAGLSAWAPVSAPSSTAFFGVDRTQDTRLGGSRYDASAAGDPIDEAIINAGALVQREGGRPDYLVLNPSQYAALARLLGSKINYVDIQVGKITFRSFEFPTAYGTVKVLADRDCPVSTGWLLQLDTWFMASLGKMPMLLDADGNSMLRQASADGYEVRVGWYGNLICKAPGWNCAINLQVPTTGP